MEIGVLALQGDFKTHRRVLETLGVDAREVRRVAQLAGLHGLVLPGGESTTLLHLMRDEPWFDAIRSLHDAGGALFGTCAGAILLAHEVRSPDQPSLGLIDATVERNAYGRQVDSFESELEWSSQWPLERKPFKAVFIRAPRFLDVGPKSVVLGSCQGAAVLLQSGRVLAATFHPELTDDLRIPRLFLDLARSERLAVASAT